MNMLVRRSSASALITFLLFLVSPVVADDARLTSCSNTLSLVESSLRSKDLNALKRRHAETLRQSEHFFEDLEARRLINAGDWQSVRATMGKEAHLAYSAQTFESWRKASELAKSTGNSPITAELLQRIHERSMEGLPFHGFEGRRLIAKHESGEIDAPTLKEQLRQTYTDNANPSGVNHKSLAGRFRWDPLDDIKHNGSSFTEEGRRYFDSQELEAARQDKQMRVIESSVKEIAPGRFVADSFYTPPQKVKQEVERVIERLNQDLDKAQGDHEVILAVARMQKELIIIHPFLDGNGRTVRLLRDFVLQRHGFPPPVLLREQEITLSVSEIADDIQQGMRLYVEAREVRLRGGP